MKQHDAIYARYSSHGQDDGTSIEVQIEQCERAAGRSCKHYIDRAKTGRSMGGRAQLLQLLDDANAGKLSRVCVYKFDRIGRSAETHLIAQQLDDAGVEFISATEGTNELARGIQLVVAADFSRQLAQRSRDGLLKRFEQCGFTGGISPYGYRSVVRGTMKALEIIPEEAEVIRDIVHQYLCECSGFKSIAKNLRGKGIVNRKGNPFCFTSVRSVLINPIISGRLQYNVRRMHLDRSTGRRVPRRKAENEIKYRDDSTLAIIDSETFARIQERIGKASRGETVRAPRGIAPLTGMIYCQCGAKCYRSKSENKKGTYFYYRCSRRQKYDDCSNAAAAKEDVVMERVQHAIGAMLERSDDIITRATDLALKEVASNREEKGNLQRELAAIGRKLSSLVEQATDPTIDRIVRNVFHREMAGLETRRNEILASLDNLHDDANDVAEALSRIVREKLDDARESLAAAASAEDYNRIVQSVVGPMEMRADGSIHQRKTAPVETDAVIRLVEGRQLCSSNEERHGRDIPRHKPLAGFGKPHGGQSPLSAPHGATIMSFAYRIHRVLPRLAPAPTNRQRDLFPTEQAHNLRRDGIMVCRERLGGLLRS